MRLLSEIEFFARGFTVPNPIFDVYTKLSGPNLYDAS
jgi:hypothetical protein